MTDLKKACSRSMMEFLDSILACAKMVRAASFTGFFQKETEFPQYFSVLGSHHRFLADNKPSEDRRSLKEEVGLLSVDLHRVADPGAARPCVGGRLMSLYA